MEVSCQNNAIIWDDPARNPLTNRPIISGGRTFRKLCRQLGSPRMREINQQKKSLIELVSNIIERTSFTSLLGERFFESLHEFRSHLQKTKYSFQLHPDDREICETLYLIYQNTERAIRYRFLFSFSAVCPEIISYKDLEQMRQVLCQLRQTFEELHCVVELGSVDWSLSQHLPTAVFDVWTQRYYAPRNNRMKNTSLLERLIDIC